MKVKNKFAALPYTPSRIDAWLFDKFSRESFTKVNSFEALIDINSPTAKRCACLEIDYDTFIEKLGDLAHTRDHELYFYYDTQAGIAYRPDQTPLSTEHSYTFSHLDKFSFSKADVGNLIDIHYHPSQITEKMFHSYYKMKLGHFQKSLSDSYEAVLSKQKGSKRSFPKSQLKKVLKQNLRSVFNPIIRGTIHNALANSLPSDHDFTNTKHGMTSAVVSATAKGAPRVTYFGTSEALELLTSNSVSGNRPLNKAVANADFLKAITAELLTPITKSQAYNNFLDAISTIIVENVTVENPDIAPEEIYQGAKTERKALLDVIHTHCDSYLEEHLERIFLPNIRACISTTPWKGHSHISANKDDIRTRMLDDMTRRAADRNAWWNGVQTVAGYSLIATGLALPLMMSLITLNEDSDL